MSYALAIEPLESVLDELFPIARRQYLEDAEKKAAIGIDMPPFKPRFDQYVTANKSGFFIFYVVRFNGAMVAYAGMYLTHDMHNSELIGREATIYVVPEHRGRVGKALFKAVVADVKERGAKMIYITPTGDPRLEKLWSRLGFKTIGAMMVHTA